jgi:hypothetical protein
MAAPNNLSHTGSILPNALDSVQPNPCGGRCVFGLRTGISGKRLASLEKHRTLEYVAVPGAKFDWTNFDIRQIEKDRSRELNLQHPLASMKRITTYFVLTLVAASVLAADSSPKDDVVAAAKKLAQKDNYSWKTTITVPPDAPFRPGPTEGKTQKDGVTFLTLSRRDSTMDAVLKGGKGAMKTEEGWKSLSEASQDDGGGGPNFTRFLAMRLQNYKVPAAEAEDLAGKTKDLKSADGVISGDLTEAGAKQLISFRPGTEVNGAKGTARFWVKDGVLTKYEYQVKGSMSFNGNDVDVDRTTSVEIKDVGTTKITVPEEASKKLS